MERKQFGTKPQPAKQEQPRDRFAGNPRPDRVTMTYRPYEDVRRGLGLRPEHIPATASVLSVGEGLSTFAQTLKYKTGARVVAADIAYGLIDPTKGLKQAHAKLNELNAGNAGVMLEDEMRLLDDEELEQAPGEPPERVEASVYKLPFQKCSFDLVTCNRLLEHIDVGAGIKEMLRVTKAGGEVRIGSPMEVIRKDGVLRLYLGRIKEEGSDEIGQTFYSAHSPFHKVDQAIDYLGKHPEVRVYVLARYPSFRTFFKDNQPVSGLRYRPATTLILCKHQELPRVECIGKAYPYDEPPKLYRVSSIQDRVLFLEEAATIEWTSDSERGAL